MKKVLSEGTENPVVARLVPQTAELVKWARLPEEKEQQVARVYLELARRLLKIDQQIGRLLDAMQAADYEMTADRKAGIQNRLPQMPGIEGEVETFLYDAKNFLRVLLGILDIFFGKKFDEAKAFWDTRGDGRGDLYKWALATFGPDDTFTRMLSTEQSWVGDIIAKRNAVEHPGKLSGTLYIENITLHPSGMMVPPVWWLNVGVGVNLLLDLETGMINLCTLAEDMLVECIRHMPSFPPYVAFYEIPVEQRNPACPVRIGVTLDRSKLKPPSVL